MVNIPSMTRSALIPVGTGGGDRQLGAARVVGHHPAHLVVLAGPLTEGSVEERFEFGLEVLVAGLERISDTN